MAAYTHAYSKRCEFASVYNCAHIEIRPCSSLLLIHSGTFRICGTRKQIEEVWKTNTLLRVATSHCCCTCTAPTHTNRTLVRTHTYTKSGTHTCMQTRTDVCRKIYISMKMFSAWIGLDYSLSIKASVHEFGEIVIVSSIHDPSQTQRKKGGEK